MRGKAVAHGIITEVHGITPAYAGKSGKCCGRILLCWDHPRLCGEKCSDSEFFYQSLGSPPPMRGKVECHISETDETRITPAYAGKRDHATSDKAGRRDHPRLCGEKETALCGWVKCIRITPAYAGKSQCTFTVCGNFRDHPRLCGEKLPVCVVIVSVSGSPPPMRGKVCML